MRWKARLLAASLILAAAPSAFAEAITVNIGSLTFAQGQTTGTLDVMISSTTGAPVNLTAFGFEFLITPVNSAPPELAFVDPQPQPFSSSSYVFFGNSADNIAGATLGGVSTTSTPGDTYSGSDGTNDGSNVVLSSATGSMLLTQLQVTLSPQFLQTAGTFDISLIPGSYGGSPATPSPDVFFIANDPNSPAGFDYENYQSNVGTVIIPAVVPEPSSIVLLAAGVLSGLLAFLLRRYRGLALTATCKASRGSAPSLASAR
jgi:PEP-CTERM motif